MKGFKEYGIEPHNYFVFSGHGYAAAKSTNYNVVGDAIEINCANPQTLVVENQHINPSEEPELTANTDSDSPKKPVSVFFISNHCLKQHNVRKKEKQKSELKHSYKHTHQRNIRKKRKAERRTGIFKKIEERSS
ncbi:UNVERIFIED_CONTAM: hypothetical protein NCL1_18128 [Trichonephila clavipes]